MSDTIRVAIYLTATVPQALALQAMFKYWNRLSGRGASRRVAFYVDGDGNFHPDAEFVNLSTQRLPPLTDELYDAAIVAGKKEGHYVFDFEAIACMQRIEKAQYEERLKESAKHGATGPEVSTADARA